MPGQLIKNVYTRETVLWKNAVFPLPLTIVYFLIIYFSSSY